MADRLYGQVVADATSISMEVILRSTVDNSLVTGVASGSVTARYYRQGDAAPNAISISALGSANAAYASGGWREISAASYPGRYRLDIPNAAFAVGVDWVGVQVVVANTFGFDQNYGIQSASLIPDQIMKRDFALITGEARRSLMNGIRFLLNRVVFTPTSFSVKKEDDVTEAYGGTVSTTAGANPITATDPT